jgi:hypothetical protein
MGLPCQTEEVFENGRSCWGLMPRGPEVAGSKAVRSVLEIVRSAMVMPNGENVSFTEADYFKYIHLRVHMG